MIKLTMHERLGAIAERATETPPDILYSIKSALLWEMVLQIGALHIVLDIEDTLPPMEPEA